MKFSLAYFKYHFRKGEYLTLFVIVFILLLLIMNTFVSNINKESFETLKGRSGEHHTVVWRSSRSKKKELDEDSDVVLTGEFINVGNYRIENMESRVSIGYLSDEALQLGHIQLVDGHFAVEENEIVLEDNLRYLNNSELNVGDTISLIINDNIEEFLITGFVENYKAFWNLEDGYTEGLTDFPGGLVSQKYAEKHENSYNFLVLQNNIEIEEDYSLMAMELLTRHEIFHFSFNDATHWRNYNIISTPVRLYRMIFLVAISFITVIIAYFMNRDYISSYISQIGIIEYLGGSLKHRIIQLIYISLIPLIAGGIISVLIYGLLILAKLIPSNLSIFSVALILLLSAVLFAVQMAVIIFNIIRQPKEKIKARNITSKNYLLRLTLLSVKRNILKVFTVILMIAFIVSVIVCVDFDNRTRAFMLIQDMDYFDAIANEGELCIWLGDFTLTSYSTKYNSHHLKYLESVLDYDIEYSYSGSRCLVLHENMDEYWNTIIDNRMTKQIIGTDMYISPNDIPAMPDNIIATDEFGFVVLNDSEVAEFRLKYPELDNENLLEKGYAILFAPPLITDRYDFEHDSHNTQELKQQYYAPGMMLTFGKVDAGGDINNVFTNKSKIGYTETEFEISAVIDTDYTFGDTQISQMPVIVVSEKSVIDNEVLDEIRHFRIVFPSDISEEEYKIIEKEFNKVAMSTKNSVITDSRFYTQYFKRFYATINTMISIITTLTFVIIAVCLTQIISSYVNEYKRQFGILKVLGMSNRLISRMILLENILYWFVGIIVIIPAVNCIFRSFVIDKFGMYPNTYDITRCLIISLIPLLILLIILLYISWIFRYRMKKMSIDEAIRIGE